MANLFVNLLRYAGIRCVDPRKVYPQILKLVVKLLLFQLSAHLLGFGLKSSLIEYLFEYKIHLPSNS